MPGRELSMYLRGEEGEEDVLWVQVGIGLSGIGFQPIWCRLIDDLRHPSHLAVLQSDLDAVGMEGGIGEKLLDHAPRPFASSLVLFEHYIHSDTGADVLSMLAALRC